MTGQEKSELAFRTISEAAQLLGVPAHVLRFWEGKFPQIKPLKRAGGRRNYRPEDMALLRGIRALLYEDGYQIIGVQKLIKAQGVAFVRARGSRVHTKDLRPAFEISSPNSAREALGAVDRTPIFPLSQSLDAIGSSQSQSVLLSPDVRSQFEAALAKLEHAQRLLTAVFPDGGPVDETLASPLIPPSTRN
ncbi:MerR family transcriptional regulator [Candidatus Phycosocius spiralis]|uniref:Transcriptional regulator n=1 Tax=Candidatus Phycosocius spiralis TaxID=2815099 RepID=A0ABQ4PY49_9PROT|nr:transcriptional regulator [Candidatus Phycosocius spiralis]